MKELHSSGSSTTNNKMLIFLLLLFFFLSPTGGGAGAHDRDHEDECKPAMCGDKGPEIRFPFWLKDHQPERCGYGPGFALTCSPTNNSETLVDLPFFFKVVVQNISYRSQVLTYQFSGCFNLSLIFNTSSPFLQISHSNLCEYYIFSCPSFLDPYYDYYKYASLTCLSSRGHHLYLMVSDSIRQNLLNCTKMHTIPAVPCIDIQSLAYPGNLASWWWNVPVECWKCEEEGKYCRRSSSNNSEKHETECFNPKPPTTRGEAKAPLVTGLIPLGIFLLVVFAIATYFTHRSIILKKEDQVKVERFLENYRVLKPTRYTYAEIKKITHNLKEKLGQGGFGTVYKGELSNDVPIAAKILNNFTGNGDDFINEVGTIGTIHHVNVVRLVGYCADGYKKALVYEYLPNDSLEKFISTDHKKASLGWEKLQDIGIGIAKGIEYLHQGCDQRILHFDIKPHNILLDKNFIPKISDFGLAKLCSKEQSVVSMTAARGTVGYIAPEVFSRNFGNVSHKSDVYSFGMLLLEMVGGRKKNIDVRAEENSDEVYFPEWIYNCLNREEVNNNEVEEGGDAKIVKKITIVGLWCIQWYPGDRPSMKAVVQMLEGDGKTLAMPPNPFSTTSQSITRGNMGGRHFSSVLEIISESD
ncbi:rust resistance kinase Lr10-like [Rhododendron vialii]|uniref:rust resistance kinase Lr10-like n=1 Tax=Rhododendron vialii TaxID=182163 RepID=UPI00265E8D13|nr:rust resistance kinase Lr10-like [Rhododendron vialii]